MRLMTSADASGTTRLGLRLAYTRAERRRRLDLALDAVHDQRMDNGYYITEGLDEPLRDGRHGDGHAPGPRTRPRGAPR